VTTPSDPLRQAKETAGDYLVNAVRDIDGLFGKGYAKANPSLVAAFMQVAAADFAAAIISKAIGGAAEELARALASQEAAP
jgi:hypothetical protein